MGIRHDYYKHQWVCHCKAGIKCSNSYGCHPRNMKKLVKRKKRRQENQALKDAEKVVR